MTETQNISDWNILSLLLGVKDADVQRIRQDNPEASLDQSKEIITAWLNTGKASWAILVSALRHNFIKREADANRIAKAHPSRSKSTFLYMFHSIMFKSYILYSDGAMFKNQPLKVKQVQTFPIQCRPFSAPDSHLLLLH